MESGLGSAQHIVDDLRELEPRAWVFWQPVEDDDNMEPQGENLNWGSIFIDLDCKPYDEAGVTVWKSARRVADAGGDSTAVEHVRRRDQLEVQHDPQLHEVHPRGRPPHGDRRRVDHGRPYDADGTGATIVHRQHRAPPSARSRSTCRASATSPTAPPSRPIVTTQAASADAPTANALVAGAPRGDRSRGAHRHPHGAREVGHDVRRSTASRVSPRTRPAPARRPQLPARRLAERQGAQRQHDRRRHADHGSRDRRGHRSQAGVDRALGRPGRA